MSLTSAEFGLKTNVARVDGRQWRSENRPVDIPANRLAAFAKLLRDTRTRRFPNQSAFCREARISRATLRALESGRQQPTQRTIDKVTTVLDISADILTGLQEIPPDPALRDLKDDDWQMARRYHHADAETKYAIKRWLSDKVSDARRERIAILVQVLLQLPDDERFNALENLVSADQPATEAGEIVPVDEKRKNSS